MCTALPTLQLMLAATLACLPVLLPAQAQQNSPPTPGELRVRRAPLVMPAESTAVPQVAPELLRARIQTLQPLRTELFKGLDLSPAQQQTLLGNMGSLGSGSQQVLQQTFRPPDPALAQGSACTAFYAGTTAQLKALRKAVTVLVEKNQPGDLPAFVANLPTDCPYRELYYHLALLAQLYKE